MHACHQSNNLSLTSIALSRLFKPQVFRFLVHETQHGIQRLRKLQQDDDPHYQATYNVDTHASLRRSRCKALLVFCAIGRTLQGHSRTERRLFGHGASQRPHAMPLTFQSSCLQVACLRRQQWCLFRAIHVASRTALPCEEHDQMYCRSLHRHQNSLKRHGEIHDASMEVM